MILQGKARNKRGNFSLLKLNTTSMYKWGLVQGYIHVHMYVNPLISLHLIVHLKLIADMYYFLRQFDSVLSFVCFMCIFFDKIVLSLTYSALFDNIRVVQSETIYCALFDRHEMTDTPQESDDVVVSINSFKSKIIRVKVKSFRSK